MISRRSFSEGGTRRLGVLGGTFDPLHFGHLDAADAARAALSLDEVLFIPLAHPPHRAAEPQASVFHRFAMAALAVSTCTDYRVSDMELVRAGSSYTWDTLQTLHASGWAATQLFVILGADAFADIATWHRYPAVLDAAHFIVIARPGMSIEASLARTPALRERTKPAAARPGSGRRSATGTLAGTAIFLVEARTRDVSSTEIRRRIADGRPIDDLVPAPVARHIATHHLYLTDDSLHADNTNNQGE